MRRFALVTALLLMGLPLIAAAQTKYPPDWAALDARPTPQWFTDAKFGIFIHYGLYSVPAFALPQAKNQNPYAEWYWNSLELGKQAKHPDDDGAATWDFHKRVYGADFKYADFVPMFRAEFFDPDAWASLIQRSGAKYVVLTSKHHDGFALWPSAEASRDWKRPWNAVEAGPHRDILGDLMQSVRSHGMKAGFYYSLYEWYNPLWLTDKKRFVDEHLFPQFKDVVTHYKPAIIFSDGEWELPSSEWKSPELLAWLFNESPVKDDVVVNDRWGKETRHAHGGYYTTEYTAGLSASTHPWEENRGMGFSFGYNRVETLADYQPERDLVLMLIDTVSRGGNLLLDIGPSADGKIPVIMEERLLQMGAWLSVNGEAIYGTKPWHEARQWSAGNRPVTKETDFHGEYNLKALVDNPPTGTAKIEAFFTSKQGAVYVILPNWPKSDFVVTGMTGGPETKASLLETGEPVSTSTAAGNLILKLSNVAEPQRCRNAHIIKITGLR